MEAPGFTVRRVNPLDVPDWDDRIALLPGATFFHGSAWARVLQETYHFRATYLVAQALTGGYEAVLPLMEVDSWLTGRRGIALPFTDECAPLSRDPAALRAVLDAVQDESRRRAWKYWEIRGGMAALGANPSVEFRGHQLRLHGGSAARFQRCDNSVRSAVRKAERSGLRVAFACDSESVRAFHRLLCQTRRRHGLPPQPLAFFENIRRHVLAPNRGLLVLACSDGQPVAGAIFFQFRDAALFKFGASDESSHHLRPNNLVMWRAIERLAETGLTTLDFGRTSMVNEGLRRYKLSWGSSERRIQYTRFDCRRRGYVAVRDASEGWHTKLFKIVPGTLARLLGAAAYKHVA